MLDIRQHGGLFGGTSGKSKGHAIFSSSHNFMHVDEDGNMYYFQDASVQQVLVYNPQGTLIKTYTGFSGGRTPMSLNKDGYVHREIYQEELTFSYRNWDHTVLATLWLAPQTIYDTGAFQYYPKTKTWMYFWRSNNGVFYFANEIGTVFATVPNINVGNQGAHSFSGGNGKAFMLLTQQFGPPVAVIALRLDLPNTDTATRRHRRVNDQYNMHFSLLTMDLSNTII